MSQSCRHKQMFEKRNDPEHPDGLMIKNFVMDWQRENYMGKEFLGEADTTGHNPDATKMESENSCHRSRLKRDENRLGRTDELRCLPHFSSCCFPWLPWLPSFCCTESEDSSNFECSEFIPATACVWLIPSCFCVWCNYTLSSTVCKCTPCQQRKFHQL